MTDALETKRRHIAVVTGAISLPLALAVGGLALVTYSPTRPLRLTILLQAVVFIVAIVAALVSYRRYAYEQRYVTPHEHDAERMLPPWKTTALAKGLSVLGAVLCRGMVAFAMAWLVAIHTGVLFAPRFVAEGLGALALCGLAGAVTGAVIAYFSVVIDDPEMIFLHIVFAVTTYVLLYAIAIGAFNRERLFIFSLEGDAFYQSIRLHPTLERTIAATEDEPPHPSLPRSLSNLGTLGGTRVLFNVFMLTFAGLTFALARDALNDWWWLKRQGQPSLRGLRVVLGWFTLIIATMIGIVAFPDQGATDSVHDTLAGLLGVLVVLAMLVIPALLPRSGSAPGVDFTLFALASRLAALISICAYLSYMLQRMDVVPGLMSILHVELIGFPPFGLWMYLFNANSKRHIRALYAQEQAAAVSAQST